MNVADGLLEQTAQPGQEGSRRIGTGHSIFFFPRTSARSTIPSTVETPLTRIPLVKTKSRGRRVATLILQAAGYSPSGPDEQEDERSYRDVDFAWEGLTHLQY